MWSASMQPPRPLALSDIPFSATVGAVRVGRVEGEFVVNPTYAERMVSTVNIMVVGHKDGIVMIEAGAKQETEEVILARDRVRARRDQEDCGRDRGTGCEGRQAEARLHRS